MLALVPRLAASGHQLWLKQASITIPICSPREAPQTPSSPFGATGRDFSAVPWNKPGHSSTELSVLQHQCHEEHPEPNPRRWRPPVLTVLQVQGCADSWHLRGWAGLHGEVWSTARALSSG